MTAVGGVRLESAEDDPGASDAFGAQVSPYFADLWRFAVSLVGFDGADDLVQECLARAWTKREQFNSTRGSTRTWLFAIMADRSRRQWSRRRPGTFIDLPGLNRDAPDDGTAGRIDLRRAVDALPMRQRTAITLRYYLDLDISEIAVVMGCSVGTVKSTLHDARKRLGAQLGGSYA